MLQWNHHGDQRRGRESYAWRRFINEKLSKLGTSTARKSHIKKVKTLVANRRLSMR